VWLDLLISIFSIPIPVWVGTIVGILGGAITWMLLPEESNGSAIGGVLIAAGFIGGLVWSLVQARKEKDDG